MVDPPGGAMADTTPSVAEGATSDRRHALHLLQAFCLLAVLACAALLSTAAVAVVAVDPSTERTMRVAMLHPGLTTLAVMIGCAALAAGRLRRIVGDEPNLRRLRERLYFVATVTALVLAPSALLGWRWAAASRAMQGSGVVLAMEALAQLIVLLLLVRNARDALRLGVQSPRAARRSISSIL